MKAPPDARRVVLRLRAPKLSNDYGLRIAVILGDKAHLRSNSGVVSWNPVGRALDTVEIVRDATAREATLGYVP